MGGTLQRGLIPFVSVNEEKNLMRIELRDERNRVQSSLEIPLVIGDGHVRTVYVKARDLFRSVFYFPLNARYSFGEAEDLLKAEVDRELSKLIEEIRNGAKTVFLNLKISAIEVRGKDDPLYRFLEFVYGFEPSILRDLAPVERDEVKTFEDLRRVIERERRVVYLVHDGNLRLKYLKQCLLKQLANLPERVREEILDSLEVEILVEPYDLREILSAPVTRNVTQSPLAIEDVHRYANDLATIGLLRFFLESISQTVARVYGLVGSSVTSDVSSTPEDRATDTGSPPSPADLSPAEETTSLREVTVRDKFGRPLPVNVLDMLKAAAEGAMKRAARRKKEEEEKRASEESEQKRQELFSPSTQAQTYQAQQTAAPQAAPQTVSGRLISALEEALRSLHAEVGDEAEEYLFSVLTRMAEYAWVLGRHIRLKQAGVKPGNIRRLKTKVEYAAAIRDTNATWRALLCPHKDHEKKTGTPVSECFICEFPVRDKCGYPTLEDIA